MATFDWSKVTNLTIPEGTVSIIKNSAGQILWQSARDVRINFGAGVAKASVKYTTEDGTTKNDIVYSGNNSQLPESLSGGAYTSVWSKTLRKVQGRVIVTIITYFNNYSRPSGWPSDSMSSSLNDTIMNVNPVLNSMPELTDWTDSSHYSYYHIGGSYNGGSGSILRGSFHDMSTSFMEILANCSSYGTNPSPNDTYYQLIRNSDVANELFAHGAPIFKLRTSVLAYSKLKVRPTYSDRTLVNGLELVLDGYTKSSMRVPALTWTRYYNTPTYSTTSISTANDYIFLLKLGTAAGSEWQVAWPSNSIEPDCPDATVTNPITQLYFEYRPVDSDSDYRSALKYFVSYQPYTNNGTNSYYCTNGIWYNTDGKKISPPPIGSPTAISTIATHTNSWSEFSKYFYSNYDNTSQYNARYIYAVWDEEWIYNP